MGARGDRAFLQKGACADCVLDADYTVRWTAKGHAPTTLVVPRGMLIDLTSVPPVFRGLVKRVGPWLEAAIVHDFRTIAWRTLDGQGAVERRRLADDVMLAAMEFAQVGFRRHLLYGALRAAALLSYPKATRSDDADRALRRSG